MFRTTVAALLLVGCGTLILTPWLLAQSDRPDQAEEQLVPPKEAAQPDFKKGRPKKGPGGPDVFTGPGGQKRQLVKQFDKDGDGWLNKAERQAAREFIKKNPRKGPGGGFGPGGFLAKPLLDALDADKD